MKRDRTFARGYSVCLATFLPLSDLARDLERLFLHTTNDPTASLELWSLGQRSQRRSLLLTRAIGLLLASSFNEAIVRVPSRSPCIAARVVPARRSPWWQELSSRPRLTGDELSIYLDHSRFQETVALDPSISIPTFIEIQLGEPPETGRTGNLDKLIEALLETESLDQTSTWLEVLGNGLHPLDLLAGYERGLDKIPGLFPRVSFGWILDDRSAALIFDALGVEERSRRQYAISRSGHSFVKAKELVAQFAQAAEVLSQWVIPRDETTRARELDLRLGEYALPDGSRVFSEQRWRELETDGLVLALTEGKALVPLIPPEFEDALGPRSGLIPAIPMHGEERSEYERELRAALERAPTDADREHALAFAADTALTKLYSAFGSPYGNYLSQVLCSVLLDNPP